MSGSRLSYTSLIALGLHSTYWSETSWNGSTNASEGEVQFPSSDSIYQASSPPPPPNAFSQDEPDIHHDFQVPDSGPHAPFWASVAFVVGEGLPPPFLSFEPFFHLISLLYPLALSFRRGTVGCCSGLSGSLFGCCKQRVTCLARMPESCDFPSAITHVPTTFAGFFSFIRTILIY